MKNFSEEFQGKYRKMPNSAEERRCGAPKQPLPQEKACQHSPIVAHPQIPPADAEEGEEPGRQELQADGSLAQPGEPGAQGPQRIHSGPQQHAAQKAPQEPPPDQCRGHVRNPRFRRGSS